MHIRINMSETDEIELLPKNPFRMLILGGSNCGKTTFALKLVKCMDRATPFRFICLVYQFLQPAYNELREAYGDRFTMTDTYDESILTARRTNMDKPGLIILDDQAYTLCNNQSLLTLMMGQSHHLNWVLSFNLILLTHNSSSILSVQSCFSLNRYSWPTHPCIAPSPRILSGFHFEWWNIFLNYRPIYFAASLYYCVITGTKARLANWAYRLSRGKQNYSWKFTKCQWL